MLRKLSLLLVLLVSCGEEKMPEPQEEELTVENFCTQMAKADCERIEKCGTAQAKAIEQCISHQEQVWCGPTGKALKEGVGRGEVAFFALAAKRCKKAVSELSCEVGLFHPLLGLDACQDMLEAKAQTGDSCTFALACAEGNYCDFSACPGTCKAYKTANQPCALNDRCSPDTYCKLTGTRRCTARSDLGAACDPAAIGNSCRDGSFCDASQPGMPVCRAGRGRQEGCQSAYECAQNAACIKNKCSLGLDGDTCEIDLHCADGRRCAEGKCAVLVALEGDCSGGLLCVDGLGCHGKTNQCTEQPKLGDSCEEVPCFLGRCVDGTCETSIGDGGACAAAGDCLPGRACSDGVCLPFSPSCLP